MSAPEIALVTGLVFGLVAGGALGLHIGVGVGSDRARRELTPLIERAMRPLSLTITQPAHAPGTVIVAENPAVAAGEVPAAIIDSGEQIRSQLRDAAEMAHRSGAGAESAVAVIVVSADPLVENLVIEEPFSVE